MAIEYGNSVEAIQVHISFFIPMATLLHPGPPSMVKRTGIPLRFRA